MEISWLQVLWTVFLLVDLSSQHQCEQCDCTVSANDASKGVHLTTLTCMDGSVTWYNPIGALRIELRPERTGHFRSCFVVDTGDVKLKVSREADLSINTKSPSQRTKFIQNDHNLQTLLTSEGKSDEVCIYATNSVILYLEPEVDSRLGYQRILFQYDSTFTSEVEKSSIEECRPCSEEEILKAYCSSDFVVVGSMRSVRHHDDMDKTKIDVEVAQIIRHTGSHFSRLRRDSPLKGTILAPRKCGVTKGDGLFLMTGRNREWAKRAGMVTRCLISTEVLEELLSTRTSLGIIFKRRRSDWAPLLLKAHRMKCLNPSSEYESRRRLLQSRQYESAYSISFFHCLTGNTNCRRKYILLLILVRTILNNFNNVQIIGFIISLTSMDLTTVFHRII